MTLPTLSEAAELALIALSIIVVAMACATVAFGDQTVLREPIVEQVDLLEVNTFYDGAGKIVFTQLVFWAWSEDFGDYFVQAWRLIKSNEMYPQRNHGHGWQVLWIDGTVQRKVTSPAIRYTYTQHDTELENRERWPKEERKELRPATLLNGDPIPPFVRETPAEGL